MSDTPNIANVPVIVLLERALQRIKQLETITNRSGCLLADYEELQKKYKSFQETHGTLLVALEYNRRERDELKAANHCHKCEEIKEKITDFLNIL